MKLLSYSQLEVGKLYTTILQRTYPRRMFSQLETNSPCGEIDPEDAFVLLDTVMIQNNGRSLKNPWMKILTTKGVIGWTIFIESLDPNPQFVELKP